LSVTQTGRQGASRGLTQHYGLGMIDDGAVLGDDVYVHSTATVEDGAIIGSGTRVWALAQIRSDARIGANCVFGRNTFVDIGVVLGNNVKVQNNASLFEGVEIDDGVFIGPHVIFTNDKVPRAVNPGGSLKSADDWELGRTKVGAGASLGAGVVVVTGTTIGSWAMIGSGSVVTRDVPAHALAVGNPARVIGWVSAVGDRCDSQEEAQRITATECATPD
jgi:UDP-2-acetamido-3-amino-2,3-dideoxy-glucuronate N-acetyltransferase